MSLYTGEGIFFPPLSVYLNLATFAWRLVKFAIIRKDLAETWTAAASLSGPVVFNVGSAGIY